MATTTEGIVGLPLQRTSHRCSHPHWQQLYGYDRVHAWSLHRNMEAALIAFARQR